MFHSLPLPPSILAGILKQFMGARNRVGIGFSYRPTRPAELIPLDQILGLLKSLKIRALHIYQRDNGLT
jgi:hypothetical protein